MNMINMFKDVLTVQLTQKPCIEHVYKFHLTKNISVQQKIQRIRLITNLRFLKSARLEVAHHLSCKCHCNLIYFINKKQIKMAGFVILK